MRSRWLMCVLALSLGLLPALALNALDARPAVAAPARVVFMERNTLTFTGTPAQLRAFDRAQVEDKQLATFVNNTKFRRVSTADKNFDRKTAGKLPSLILADPSGNVLYEAHGRDALYGRELLQVRHAAAKRDCCVLKRNCDKTDDAPEVTPAPASERKLPVAQAIVVGLVFGTISFLHSLRERVSG